MQRLLSVLFSCVCTFATLTLSAATTNSSLPGQSPTVIPPIPYPKPQQPVPTTPYKPLPRPVVPAMEKPFGMPGVIGLNNGKWEGTDYLGHLSKNISVDVEVLKGENSGINVDIPSLQSQVADLLKNADIIPHALVQEGPPLPFLHVLVIIYPADKDKFVIFCTCRLFEEIRVVRKNFQPAGYWQGITWENQDISLASSDKVASQAKTSVENLVKAFIERYRLYNREFQPDGTPASTPQARQ